MPVPYRRLGRVVKAHGTDGEVSVVAAGSLTVLRPGTDVWIVPPPASGARARRIAAVRNGPKGPLVRLSDIETAAEAHEIVGRWLLCRGEEPQVGDASDPLLGMRVKDGLRGDIGVVTDVIVTGANDVLVVTGGPFGEVLVPVIDDVIRATDTVTNTIDVALLDGLIDEDD
jgi:16S rRNA processing protein RimM